MKIKLIFLSVCLLALGSIGLAQSQADENTSEGYSGTLQVGETESLILYFGEESGDYAAFCFMNDSEVGRRILAACKDGEQCEIDGEIDGESPCKVPGLEADLSAAGKITSLKSVRSLAPKNDPAEVSNNSTVAPETVVANLYASQNNGQGPFFQTTNRALVDRYFAKDLADMIWKDMVDADGEVGAIDFDPLYNAQDTEITSFVIEKPRDDGGPDNAFVKVTFKNFGKAEMIDYELRRESGQPWKITGIYYSDGEDLGSLLLYSQDEEFRKEYDAYQTFTGEYLVGTVECTVTLTLSGFSHRVKCANEENFKLYTADGDETQTAYIYIDEDGNERDRFVFKTGETNGKFIDATGKEVKVTRK